jgi:hypothetical protein
MKITHREAGNAFVFFEFEDGNKTNSIIVSTEKFMNYLNKQKKLPIDYDFTEKDEDGQLWLSTIHENKWYKERVSYLAIQVLKRVDQEHTVEAVKHFDKVINKQRYENQIA